MGNVSSDMDSKKNMIRFTFKQVNESIQKYQYAKNEYESLRDFIGCSLEDYYHFCEELKVSPGDLAETDEILAYEPDNILNDWMEGYYFQLEDMVAENIGAVSEDFIIGLKSKAFADATMLIGSTAEVNSSKKDLLSILFNESRNDIFEMYQNLYLKGVKAKGRDNDIVSSVFRALSGILIQIESEKMSEEPFYNDRMHDYENMLDKAQEIMEGRKELEEICEEVNIEEITGSLQTIIDYSEIDSEIGDEFINDVETYKGIVNKNSSSDEVRHLKDRLSRNFYEIYISAFLKGVIDRKLPTILRMFFDFGYVDEELAGFENAVALYRISKNLPTNHQNRVYSFFEWLQAIYFGEKNPSRNEFDVDFAEYLHEEVLGKRITKEEEKNIFADSVVRVRYELEQVFPSINKTTSGRIMTFCPLFSEHNAMRDLESILVSATKVNDIIAKITSIDYSAFYRQVVYSNPESGINREYLDVEILPDIILAPNIGSRAMMWQEIEGKRRNTPARMFISIFEQEDLEQQVLRLVGQFRWEMCKRVQGGRWNDVTDKSLTSLYFDYVQFYKKNKELSADAKTKIKNELVRSKNSFREMFIRDYISWMKFESNGSPRLNKVARAILLEFVPFSREIRARLAVNPMYREQIERYEIKQKAKIHKIDNLMVKIRNMNHQVPNEIIEQKNYLSM